MLHVALTADYRLPWAYACWWWRDAQRHVDEFDALYVDIGGEG
jgi:hypothetical protein